MTAPDEVSGWPEATVERVAEAIRDADYRYECAESVQMSLDPATYFPTLARAALSGLPDPTADTVQQALVRDDAVWMAKLARGSSWPGEMAHNVEQAANRVIAAYGSDADRAAIAALAADRGEA